MIEYVYDNLSHVQGWGCAYRSLQTIYSWFIHNKPGLLTSSNKKVPLIPAIQQALVSMEDKPKSFIGVCITFYLLFTYSPNNGLDLLKSASV